MIQGIVNEVFSQIIKSAIILAIVVSCMTGASVYLFMGDDDKDSQQTTCVKGVVYFQKTMTPQYHANGKLVSCKWEE